MKAILVSALLIALMAGCGGSNDTSTPNVVSDPNGTRCFDTDIGEDGFCRSTESNKSTEEIDGTDSVFNSLAEAHAAGFAQFVIVIRVSYGATLTSGLLTFAESEVALQDCYNRFGNFQVGPEEEVSHGIDAQLDWIDGCNEAYAGLMPMKPSNYPFG